MLWLRVLMSKCLCKQITVYLFTLNANIVCFADSKKHFKLPTPWYVIVVSLFSVNNLFFEILNSCVHNKPLCLTRNA